MRNKGALLAFAAMAMATDMRFSSQISDETLKNGKHIPVKPKVIPKGCSKFSFDGFECIAINEKSALRKYNAYLKTITT